MNYGLKTKSELCRAAESGLKREQQRDNLKVAAVVIWVFFVFMLVAVIEQVIA
jgi:hypothetical protein